MNWELLLALFFLTPLDKILFLLVFKRWQRFARQDPYYHEIGWAKYTYLWWSTLFSIIILSPIFLLNMALEKLRRTKTDVAIT